MNKIFDRILTIVLIALVIALIYRLVLEIKTMTQLGYVPDCIKINEEYYCKVRSEESRKNILKEMYEEIPKT